jgi:DNA-binding MarR family transcriptional regulator
MRPATAGAPVIDPCGEAAAGDGAALFRALSDLRRLVRRTIRRDFPLAPLSPSQAELLDLVDRRPGIGVRDAAETLRLAPNTISTLVRTLTDAGLLARDRDETDARAVRLRVTRNARRRIAAWQQCSARALDDALGNLTDDDRRRIVDALPALARLAQQLKAADPEPRVRP